MEEEVKRITVKIPLQLWKDVRRAQEDGRMKSFQAETIEGLKSRLFVTTFNAKEWEEDEGVQSSQG